jgi:puromycin-sensitive aminopeptidase
MQDPNRLPRSVFPRRYDLTIAPDLGDSTFAGSVRIELDVQAPTDTIVLHASELEIDEVTLSQGTATLAAEPEHERIVVTCSPALSAGPATIDLRFRGEIDSGLVGFYRSSWVDDDGIEQVIGTTQFEAPHARRAFPCFDEPEFKAVFSVTLDVASDVVAISNGEEISREQRGDRTVVRFADTIPMSTYLVAWVVGPLEISPSRDANGVEVRVVHVPGKGHLAEFALDVGAFAISFFSDYYGIPYPGAKCDLVALPDFTFGAMENLGCVTFREARLLLDPAATSFDELAGSAQTIFHEIAHMWFGDLVTMKWWNGIWLNEAFATFMEHVGVEAYKPEWHTWDDFCFPRVAALDVDALHTTRTVEYDVITPADANGMFDTLTYQKGGSVLRMLSTWLGDEAFRAGVRHYLDRYKLSNTETTDLWDALEDATGQPVRRIMDSWIFQPGFPMLRPSEGAVEQRRFTYREGADDARWAVPMRARIHTNGQSETRAMLLAGDQIALDAPADALIVLNAGGDGFYRVGYPAEWRDRLLESGVLEVKERVAVADDLWALVLAGEARADEFLTSAERYAAETDLIVWRVLCAHLRAAGRLVEGEALARYRQRVGALIAPTLHRLGWDAGAGESARQRQLRGILMNVSGSFVEDPETLGRAREIEDRGSTDPDLAAASVIIVASNGRDDDFDRFLTRMHTESTPQDYIRHLHALGDFPTEELLLRAVQLALSDEVRPANGPFVFQRALRSREHGPAVWAFVRDHWSEICERFAPNLLTRIMEGVTWIVDDATANDITSFVAANPIPEGARVISQHVERLQVHRAAVARERERFSKFLLGAD